MLETVWVEEFEAVEGGLRVVTKGLKIRKKPPPRAPDEASEARKSSNVVTIRK